MDKEPNPPTVRQHSRGILLYFYSGKALTRLFVVLAVIVKPFDDVVAGYTSRDSDQKSSNNFHVNTSPCCQVLGGQQLYHIINLGVYNLLKPRIFRKI